MKKNLRSAGFTLIELLAVITILGILMMVAIPSVSRTIENSRRDTFGDVAKEYVNTVRNAVLADELECGGQSVGATPDGLYYYRIDTTAQGTKDLMESGGKSSWSNAELQGYIGWYKKTATTKEDGENTKTTTTYSVLLVDAGQHGIDKFTKESEISRSKVTSAATTTKYDKDGADGSAGVATPTYANYGVDGASGNAVECTLK